MSVTLTPTSTFDALETYFRDLHRFGLRLSDESVKFQQQVRQGKFSERGPLFSYDQNNPAHVLNRSIDITRSFEFLVAFTGAFSSGKSTLLNVLLDDPDLLPASAIPLTAVCTVIRYGREPGIRVRCAGFEECFERVRSYIDRPFKKPFTPDRLEEATSRPENFLDRDQNRKSLGEFARLLSRYGEITRRPVTFAERFPFTGGGGVTMTADDSGFRYFVPTPGQEQEYLAAGGDPGLWVTREWLALIRDVTLWTDSPLLHNNIVFLDLPGLNCREDYHRRAIHEYCNMADCIVVTAFQPGNQADEDVVENFRSLSANYREKLFFVLNRVDQFQNEPQELVRSFDYLTRDCIGQTFPVDRCFLTSAYLAREGLLRSREFDENLERFASSFQAFGTTTPVVGDLIRRSTSREDPGGVKHFRDSLHAFLRDRAYPTKIGEVLQNYENVINSLRDAASPHYDEVLRMDRRELLLRSAMTYFSSVEQMVSGLLYRFKNDYLRGANGAPNLSQDLSHVLERAHQQIRQSIVKVFNQPIPTPPPRDEPVGEFDLRRVADDASVQLRREFQELITSSVVGLVRNRFHDQLNRLQLREHIENLFRGAPQWTERIDRLLERFEFMLRHSFTCKVRVQFYRMPGGRDLRRLDRGASSVDMKKVLIQVFSEFYPDWIYQNVYTEIQNGLWLHFFLDTEEFDTELRKLLGESRAAITSAEVLDRMKIPEQFGDGHGDLWEVATTCKDIERLVQEYETLKSRAAATQE